MFRRIFNAIQEVAAELIQLRDSLREVNASVSRFKSEQEGDSAAVIESPAVREIQSTNGHALPQENHKEKKRGATRN